MPRCAASLLLALLALGCGGNPAPAATVGFPASEIGFKGHFGTTPDRGTFCLMGSGFFREPRSGDLDATVADWLAAHPGAEAIVLARAPFEPPFGFVWVRDGDETLNLLLVERGACPGGVMGVDPEWLTVPEEEYEALLEEVWAAEWRALEAGAGIWGMEIYEGERHLTRAGHLQKRGQYLEAAAEYRKTVPLMGSRRGTWFRIAECMERAGNHAEALAAYDRAIEADPFAVTHVEKARFLERTRGPDHAVTWFESLIRASPSKPEPRYWMGIFHMKVDRPGPAVTQFRLAVDLACLSLEARFENGGNLVVPEGREYGYHDFALLADSLHYLARLHASLGENDEALRTATMGLAVIDRMEVRRRSEFPWEDPAPDVGCRLVRASVLLRTGDGPGARRELERAEAILAEGSDTDRGNRDAVRAVRAELDTMDGGAK